MNLFIATLLRVALTPISKAVVGALGPVIRSIAGFGLSPASIGLLFGFVAARFKGETPKFVALDALSADDVADLATGLHDATKALMAEYQLVVLTDAQVATILTAVGTRIQQKMAPAPLV